VDVVRRNPSLLAASIAALALLSGGSATAAPNCGEAPETVGNTIVGTPCADTVRAPRGITTIIGEGGDDTLYGQRGNDTLLGGPGNDRLYGGVGDDELLGGTDDDRLSGGFGADSLDGQTGDDFARGDATVDALGDSGGGLDVLSFATGVTPGFPNPGNLGYQGFPESAVGRGVFVDLGDDFANDGLAPSGGGVDKPILGAADFAAFETVIGTPFDDLIVGTNAAQTIYGGGGADVLRGEGGGDRVFGGAEGDYCEATGAGATASECEFSGSEKEVEPRNPATVSVGEMAPQADEPPALYVIGSSATDSLIETPPAGESPDSIVIAGLDGNDALSAAAFPESTSVILLGGEGADGLSGGATEDALVDGAGNDSADAGAGDDAVPNNGGADQLHAGNGEDLFISNAVCDGDLLDGGPDRDNANWANFNTAPVSIDMGARQAGLVGSGGQPQCATPSLLTALEAIEDTEGTNLGDAMVGDSGPNQLLGRLGPDSYHAGAGDDSILANSGKEEPDPDPLVDCGDGWDTAQIDFPANGPDAAPVNCEDVEERAPNSFRPPSTPTGSGPASGSQPARASSASPAKPPKPDRTAPRTLLLRRPLAVVFTSSKRRRVAVSFASNEHGSSFRCKLDGSPFKPCRSPRAYMVRPGRHTIRVYAIDAAGNRDRTPAVIGLRVRRR